MTVNEISASLQSIEQVIRKVNPHVQCILTVSPVRHLRDGLVENSRSKAHLLAAVYQNMERSDSGDNAYFPSYEIVLDELRDYRFYAADMIHPNPVAIDYIWERFKEQWIDPEIENTMSEIDAIQKGLQHRPFNPESEAHIRFQATLKDRIKRIKAEYSHIKF